ncbi:hypothetical protein FACS189475_01490 [Betaproteobacteria bacterium]|nr:hypothetical protein FACS189475_01490 [Betaproteobacteria bacterium]
MKSDLLYNLSMVELHYTAVHVRDLLKLSRTELQRWLSALPPFNQALIKARTARKFTISDLVFFSIVANLHQRLGMSLSSIATFSTLLHEQLGLRPALTGTSICIYMNLSDKGIWSIDTEVRSSLSLVLDLEPIWQAVYQFVGIAVQAQQELALGLVSLPTTQEHSRDLMV